MSRTYRRVKLNRSTRKYYNHYSYYIYDYIRVGFWYIKVPMDRNSKNYKIELNKFYSDSNNYRCCKEPGPSYFRNLTTERPLRRYNKLELHKYILDYEYEPNIIAKGKLEYWT